MLSYRHIGWTALFEYDHDAVATAAGRQDVYGKGTGTLAEENADRIHAAGLEHIGWIRADPKPEAAPLGYRGSHDLFGLPHRSSTPTPLAEFDILRGRACNETQEHGSSE